MGNTIYLNDFYQQYVIFNLSLFIRKQTAWCLSCQVVAKPDCSAHSTVEVSTKKIKNTENIWRTEKRCETVGGLGAYFLLFFKATKK
jgi:hypothetical protein